MTAEGKPPHFGNGFIKSTQVELASLKYNHFGSENVLFFIPAQQFLAQENKYYSVGQLMVDRKGSRG